MRRQYHRGHMGPPEVYGPRSCACRRTRLWCSPPLARTQQDLAWPGESLPPMSGGMKRHGGWDGETWVTGILADLVGFLERSLLRRDDKLWVGAGRFLASGVGRALCAG